MNVEFHDATWGQKAGAALQYFRSRLGGYPTLINLEVTRRCNARCGFCRYWSETPREQLTDYLPVIRKLRPSVVVFTGGEPLLRRDLGRMIKEVRRAFPAMYLGLVTNGSLLTVELGIFLWNQGLNQITVSLDYLDGRHDAERSIPGLTRKILNTVPELIAAGIDNLVVQTVIKSDNLDCVSGIIDWVLGQGARISLSAYSSVKNGNRSHNVEREQLNDLRRLIGKAMSLRLGGDAVVSSSFYLGRIPDYFEYGTVDGCTAGRRFVTVSPDGFVYPCSESSEGCPYTEWTPERFQPTSCNACWVPCRGESQAPISWQRLKQVASLYRGKSSRRPAVPCAVPGIRTTGGVGRQIQIGAGFRTYARRSRATPAG